MKLTNIIIKMNKHVLITNFKQYIDDNKTEFIKKDSKSIRVLTYNVHNWSNCDNVNKFDEIFDVIAESGADIVGLNEATFFTSKSRKDFDSALAGSKYKYMEMCNGRYGINIILSVYPFISKKVICLGRDPIKKENRYALKCCFDIGSTQHSIGKVSSLNIVLTHLDVYDESEDTRLEQIKMIIGEIDTEFIIIGDLNSLRKNDYSKEQLSCLISNDKKRGVDIQNKVTKFIETNGFVDSFVLLDKDCPTISVWSMRRVDFIFVGISFPYKVINSNIYHTNKSDHLPIYIDIQ